MSETPFSIQNIFKSPILLCQTKGLKMKILLVEDDQSTAKFIIKGLKQEGYIIDYADNGEDGLHLAQTESYDVAIFDLMLPKIDGLTIIRLLRGQRIDLPILILSAKNTVPDRVKGLQSGSDDYLVKPFAFSELVARLQVLSRRKSNVSVTEELGTLSIGEISIDRHRQKVFVNKQEVTLQPKEVILLEYLIRNQGKVVSKTMIMEHVWDYNFDPQTNVVEAKISKLRSKLSELTSINYIYTIKGLGYVCEIKE